MVLRRVDLDGYMNWLREFINPFTMFAWLWLFKSSMQLDKEQFEVLYQGLPPSDDLDQLSLLRVFLDFIDKVDEETFEQSELLITEREKVDTIIVNLKCKQNIRCNLSFYVSKNNIVDILVGIGDGEYLFNQQMTDYPDIDSLFETLYDLFYNPVHEELVYCNDKIIKCKYSIPYYFKGKMTDYKFSSVFGACLPWKTKVIRTNDYEPWIK